MLPPSVFVGRMQISQNIVSLAKLLIHRQNPLKSLLYPGISLGRTHGKKSFTA